MEQPSGRGHGATWRATFQRIYLRRLVAALRRQRIEHATSIGVRSRAVKLAADLSLAIMKRGRTAWSRAIIDKHLLRLNKSQCQWRLIKSKGNSRRKRISVSAKTRAFKRKCACKNPYGRRSQDHCDDKAESSVASRMQTLRAIVPGSHGLDTPVFLSEVADYIVTLEMQVQAMHALANEYSNSVAYSTCQV